MSSQHTLRNVPDDLDRALRDAAHRSGKSLNRTAIDALREGLGVGEEERQRRDLSDVVGTWEDDGEIDAVLEEQRRIDPADWR